ncbi:calcium transporter [Lecanosticta acicola]|uniref:Calcium transporter n=1 Tax=Lecanosticta acicola TaxID=111012 RepID=A0AAI8Z9L9_9PEZI|nr:calcium transporter [Lecanosticta acicola]
MALVYLKRLIFPQKKTKTSAGERQRLLLDVERQSSVDSGLTSHDFDDKPAPQNSSSFLRCKINPRIISDATIGLSDGLTVPFALTAGLSALGTTRLVIYAGFAELVAGAISMGLGGYLGAKSEAHGYYAALSETKDVVAHDTEKACGMVRSTFARYNFSVATMDAMVRNLMEQPEGQGQFVEFLMRFHHQLAEADFTPSRAYVSGLTIAMGYFCGGLVPLLPYLFFERVREALYCSILVMAIALFVFGWVKTALVGECSRWVCFQNAIQMLVLGGLAAGAAMGCVKAIGGGE